MLCYIGTTITSGVPQDSILGPLLFNIFVNDIILFAKNSALCNYADGNTQFSCEKTIDQVTNNLQTDCHFKYGFSITSWSWIPEKYCFVTLENGNNFCNFSCDDVIIKNSFLEKILGLTIDKNLDFSDHISNICKTCNN